MWPNKVVQHEPIPFSSPLLFPSPSNKQTDGPLCHLLTRPLPFSSWVLWRITYSILLSWFRWSDIRFGLDHVFCLYTVCSRACISSQKPGATVGLFLSWCYLWWGCFFAFAINETDWELRLALSTSSVDLVSCFPLNDLFWSDAHKLSWQASLNSTMDFFASQPETVTILKSQYEDLVSLLLPR